MAKLDNLLRAVHGRDRWRCSVCGRWRPDCGLDWDWVPGRSGKLTPRNMRTVCSDCKTSTTV